LTLLLFIISCNISTLYLWHSCWYYIISAIIDTHSLLILILLILLILILILLFHFAFAFHWFHWLFIILIIALLPHIIDDIICHTDIETLFRLSFLMILSFSLITLIFWLRLLAIGWWLSHFRHWLLSLLYYWWLFSDAFFDFTWCWLAFSHYAIDIFDISYLLMIIDYYYWYYLLLFAIFCWYWYTAYLLLLRYWHYYWHYLFLHYIIINIIDIIDIFILLIILVPEGHDDIQISLIRLVID